MNLADRLAAARAAGMTQDEAERAAALLTDDVREPGEGLPVTDRHVPDPISPVESAVAAANAIGGKRRAGTPETHHDPHDVAMSDRLTTAANSTAGGSSPAAETRNAPTVNLDVSARRGKNGQGAVDRIEELKSSVHVSLLQQMGPRLYDSDMDQNELDTEVRKVLVDVLGAQDRPLSSSDRARVTQEISDDILGYGPIEPFLRDPDVSEVMVNSHRQVYVENNGRLMRWTCSSKRRGAPPAHHRQHRRRSAAVSTSPARWWTPVCPTARVSTRSSRRLAVDGPVITIRKFGADPLTVQNLVQFGSMTPEIADFLDACVRGPPERPRLRRHRLGQDHAAQRALVVHSGRRAHRDHRGRRRAAAAAAPRHPAGDAPGQHRGHRRGHHSATW